MVVLVLRTGFVETRCSTSLRKACKSAAGDLNRRVAMFVPIIRGILLVTIFRLQLIDDTWTRACKHLRVVEPEGRDGLLQLLIGEVRNARCRPDRTKVLVFDRQ